MKNKEKLDRFAQMANGGKKLTGEIKRLEEIPPRKINRIELPCKDVSVSKREFNEREEYKNFFEEKAKLKEHYLPFLLDFSPSVNNDLIKTDLKEFLFKAESQIDKADFTKVLTSNEGFEKITVPHYVGPDGRWNAFYKTNFNVDNKPQNRRFILEFECVDYIAEVYINGRVVGTHEGFFASFSFDITDYIKIGENQLFVVVKNDYTTTGTSINGVNNRGDKIYGATHLGYDEPELGWHHCPAGLGITGKVTLLECNNQRITDIFVRPNIDDSKITVNTSIQNYTLDNPSYNIEYSIYGRNFQQTVFENKGGDISQIRISENIVTQDFELQNFKLWTINEPYLYTIKVTLKDKDGKIIDEQKTHFGMRKFIMDECSTPKGKFYFNNERIILRGTNEMGHLPRAVMENNDEQLLDDILTAKVANLNYYRMTQRPVHKKIYEFFDMTGMLCQTDFPLFSYLKQSALASALKQVCEMEKHVRNHPCCIIDTFCNETLDKTAWGEEQYVLGRLEIEKFFNAAKEIVLLYNPDRVIKYNEGDYAPIENTYGISDFHTYTYWYVSHALPSGKFNKGYLPPIRKDWMTGCGEYGCDGLDTLELMKKYCPKSWYPNTDAELWSPVNIAKEQCYLLHGDFFTEQENAKDWISVSREHQRYATKELTLSLRRRVDYVQSTAIHLLIDAWPCGWTKALVDVDRMPKPAYYALKEATLPFRVNLRRDRYTLYNDEVIKTEVYLLNDTGKSQSAKINLAVYENKELKKGYSVSAIAKGCSADYIGEINYTPTKGFEGIIEIRTETLGENSTYDSVEFKVVNRFNYSNELPAVYGEKVIDFNKLCGVIKNDNLVVCDQEYFVGNQEKLEKFVTDGGKLVLFINKPLEIMGEFINFRIHSLEEEVRANNFVARNENSKYTKEFGELDFRNFYNSLVDYQDLTAWFKFEWKDAEEILYTYEYTGEEQYKLHKKHKYICAEKKFGKGSIILSTISTLNGCIGCNPVLDKFLVNLFEM